MAKEQKGMKLRNNIYSLENGVFVISTRVEKVPSEMPLSQNIDEKLIIANLLKIE